MTAVQNANSENREDSASLGSRPEEKRTMRMIDETVRFTTLLAEDSLNPAQPRRARFGSHRAAMACIALLKGFACTAAAVALLFFTYRLVGH
ncbi:hypothetical protein [Paraburkholderia sp. 2C]